MDDVIFVEIADGLSVVNEHIRRLNAAQAAREWSRNNLARKKKTQAKWYSKFGREYNRNYKRKK